MNLGSWEQTKLQNLNVKPVLS